MSLPNDLETTTEIIERLKAIGCEQPLRALAQLKRHMLAYDTAETRAGKPKRTVTVEMLRLWGSSPRRKVERITSKKKG